MIVRFKCVELKEDHHTVPVRLYPTAEGEADNFVRLRYKATRFFRKCSKKVEFFQ